MKKIFVFTIPILLYGSIALSQTTYLPLGSDAYLLLDRLETKSGRLSDSLCLTVKPESRCRAVNFLQSIEKDKSNQLSKIDLFNIEQMRSENGEWPIGSDNAKDSKHPIFRKIYKKQYDLFHVNTKDFFFVLNPVINYMVTADNEQPKKNPNGSLLTLNSKGIEARGRITSKIGFYTMLTDNQEMTPLFLTDYSTTKKKALPGGDYYLKINNKDGTFDYFYASGYIDFSLIKNYMNLTFGNGKNFVGDGIRSLFLSDNSANTTFLKIDTRIWKFNYENLFLELTPPFNYISTQLPHTYMTIHDLSINVSKRTNLGIFETIVFNRPNTYEVDYLNPIIFYRFVERYNGSPDNVLLGFTAKTIVGSHLQFYGQFMLDEFTGKELLAGRGYWGNKWGFQTGFKYFDALNIRNLDIQGEVNGVRPYTYSHDDSLINYSNYNQPLAHPLGSSFLEFIGIARYQPTKKLAITLKGMYYVKGADTGNVNFGNNIFLNYYTAPAHYGIPFESNGVKTNCLLLSANFSYRLFPNVFIDFGGAKRNFNSEVVNKPITSTTGTTTGNMSSTYFYVGLRMNAQRRSYDAYY